MLNNNQSLFNSILFKTINTWRAKNIVNNYKKKQKPLKLDLGCGSTKRNEFIGIDLSKHADLKWNVTWGLPFPDDSVFEIRSDHFFEHLDLCDVVKVLKECHRVLYTGGILDFTIPHINPYLEAYLSNNISFLKEKINDISIDKKYLYNTSFDLISWLLYREGEHHSFFDRESILDKVKLAGFNQVHTRNFDPEKDINCRFSSIYIVAQK